MTIVYILLALIVGWVIGFLDSNLRTSKKIQAAEARAELAISEAKRKAEKEQPQLRAESPPAVDDPGLMRLKNVDGAPSLEVDGVILNVRTVSPDQRKRLIELLNLIRPWVESGQPQPPVSKPLAPVSAQPAASFTPAPSQPLPPVQLVEERVIRSLSIVGQIDAILQTRLKDTPLASQAIRLTESTIGGVEVYVGAEKYPSIDDVPDQEIKAAIRAAVAEWEDKFTPGA